jgi:hypothetical protein
MVAVVFTALTAIFGWYGIDHMHRGTTEADLAKDGTYQRDFLLLYGDYISGKGGVVVTKDVDYPEYQQTMLDVQEALMENKWVSQQLTIRDLSWFADSPQSFLSGVSSDPLTPVPAATFYPAWRAWLQGLGATNTEFFSCVKASTQERISCLAEDDDVIIKASYQQIFFVDQVREMWFHW